jgi:hypothetical protein
VGVVASSYDGVGEASTAPIEVVVFEEVLFPPKDASAVLLLTLSPPLLKTRHGEYSMHITSLPL